MEPVSSVSTPISSRPRSVLMLAIFGIIFGAVTLKSGGSVLFVDGAFRASVGNYVDFVVWFNFISGFAYILAGIGLIVWKRWAVRLSVLIAASSVIAFAAFGVHIAMGGEYEMRTVIAMMLRSATWIAIAALSFKSWKKKI